MKAVFWDFDATLGYNDGRWTNTLTDIVNSRYPELGIACDDIRPYMKDGPFPWHHPEKAHPGQTADQWWDSLKPMLVRAYLEAGAGDEQAQELAGLVRGAYLDPKKWHLFDDTVACLERLGSDGWTHYILSNHVPELPQIVESLGIAHYFAEISTSAATGYEKPNPAAFLGLAGLLPADSVIWMVGDNFEADVRGAEAVGIPAILARSTRKDAVYCCESLREVPDILAGQFSPLAAANSDRSC